LKQAQVSNDLITQFVNEIMATPECAFIFSEKNGDVNTFIELKNLMLLTEKQGKTFCGLMLLKPDCNTQGLYDMGIHPEYGPGFRKWEGDYIELVKKTWNVDNLPTEVTHSETLLQAKNIFVFGDNIIEKHPHYKDSFDNADFV
jgi:predicted molibdopterin-dependent oxidoreductase YjgC